MSDRPFEHAPTPPHSPDAEASVVGGMLAESRVVGEVIGTLLEPRHFYLPAMRALFHEIVAAYYADDPIDPLSIGELTSKTLSRAWRCEEAEAVRRVQTLASGRRGSESVDHARIVKRDSDYRDLLDLAAKVQIAVAMEQENPDVVAGEVSQTAMQIATSTLLTHEILSFDDLGRRFEAQQRRLMAARAQGIELGAYFGLSFLDNFLRGLQPTELCIIAGEPGAGKSAVSWKATQNFGERQMQRPSDRRVGALVLSLEMGEEPSNVRLATANTGIDGGRMREGRTDEDDLHKIVTEWGKRKGIPVWFNFTSTLRSGQMRALIVEAIRRHNVGLVVIDHLRYFDMDGRFGSALEEEEAKARFLKEQIAKELNVAVIALAHTTKAIESTDDRRPRLSHLRGSGQVAAHADFVGFVYRPYNHAKREDIDEGKVKRTDAEMIWAKNRHGLDGTARFHFDPSTMNIH
jgi:replicative DNA helicase